MKRVWTRSETEAALKLYCLTPFGRIHAKNPQIKYLAEKLGRSANSVALKMANFASLDPTIDKKGMTNSSKLDKEVWDDFFNNMDKFFIEEPREKQYDGFSDAAQEPFLPHFPDGADILRVGKQRKNQDFFRLIVLASYECRCAVTGIDVPALLIASHIVPWSVDQKLRTNPMNSICLNSLHDKAFDRGLITFDDDLSIIYSSQLTGNTCEFLRRASSKYLTMPSKFRPSPDFLSYHRSFVFKG